MDAALFDAIVADPRFLPYRGWHDDYADARQYLPAVQQHRAEFLALIDAIERHGIASGKALQIGLGCAGGAHRLFGAIFSSVVTIEIDIDLAAAFRAKFGEHNRILRGHSRHAEVIAAAAANAPYDFLFIDGAHDLRTVREDCFDYAPMVRAGGMIALHDAVQRGPHGEIEVHLFLDFLRDIGISVEVVDHGLGTAWFFR